MTADRERARVHAAVQDLLAAYPDPAGVDAAEFLGAQYDAGLAWVHFAVGCGGLGVAAGWQEEVDVRLRRAGAPLSRGDFMGLHQVAAALHAAGDPRQKQRFLRPIFTGQEHWCQLFSEPGAGSDLAGLATSAVRDGDEWIVTGQKVWTSGAREADWAILVARTDPDVPKHRGLTFFVCDMRAPGIEVRPLRQADGGAHFNEVFLTEVRVPDELRVGAVGQGWGISLLALDSERSGTTGLFARPVGELLKLWEARADRSSPAARALRDDVVRMWVEARVVDLCRRRLPAMAPGGGAASLASLAKILASEHVQRLSGVMAAVMGPSGQVGVDYTSVPGGEDDLTSMSPVRLAVRARALSIEGGTNEIQRNILAERFLGLPGDVRVDKSLPWREVPRS